MDEIEEKALVDKREFALMKTRICLNAMVGNESNTIARMLESVAPHIDYYVIQCNGKEDNTQEIVDNFFKERNFNKC